MFSVVLTTEEIAYLAHELKLTCSEHSPIAAVSKKKIAASHKKKIERELKEAKALVKKDGDKDFHINTLVTAALGVVANPTSMLEMLITAPGKQERRSFFAFQETWLGLAQPDDDTYILTTPITEQIIRDFVFQQLVADKADEHEVMLASEEIILAAILFDLYKSKKQSFSLTDVQDYLINTKNPALDFYRGVYDAIHADAIKEKFNNFVKKGYLAKDKDNYKISGELLPLAQANATEKTIEITRFDLDDKKPNLRSLTLLQGEKNLVLRQTTVAKPPIMIYKQIDKTQASLIVSLAIFSPEEFARQFAPVFDELDQAKKKTEEESKPKENKLAETQPEPAKPTSEKPTDKAKDEVKERKAKDDLKSTSKCAKCQADLPPDAKFCRACGAKVEEVQKNLCPKCSAELPADAKFCRECGTKIN